MNVSEGTPVESQKGRKRRPKFEKNVTVDPKKNAAILVQKLREKSKASSNQNKVEVNVQKLLKLSKSNVAHTNKERKVRFFPQPLRIFCILGRLESKNF